MSTLKCIYYFKIAYETFTKSYEFHPMITVEEFIKQATDKILIDFQISEEYAVEIVEAGHSNNCNGKDPEQYNAVQPSHVLIYNKLGKNNAFYIRKVLKKIPDLTSIEETN